MPCFKSERQRRSYHATKGFKRKPRKRRSGMGKYKFTKARRRALKKAQKARRKHKRRKKR